MCGCLIGDVVRLAESEVLNSGLHPIPAPRLRCGKFSRLNRFNLENYSLPIFQNVLYPNSWITVLVNRIVVPQVCPILLFMACSFVVQSGIVTPAWTD